MTDSNMGAISILAEVERDRLRKMLDGAMATAREFQECRDRIVAEHDQARAERDEAIEALRRLEPYGGDAAPNELEGATALAGLDPGTYWRMRHQLLRAEIRKACALLAKHASVSNPGA